MHCGHKGMHIFLKGKCRNLTSARFSVCYSGPQLWNELDTNLKQSASLPIFKKKLKQQLLERYKPEGFAAES